MMVMRKKVSRGILWALTVIYFVVLVKLILFKTQIGPVRYIQMDHVSFLSNLKSANLVPVRGIVNLFGSNNSSIFILQNIIGNLIGFMPLGFLFYYLYSPVTLKNALKVSFLTSLAFEVVQVIFVLGHFDIDDIILNTIGGVLGFIVAKILYRTFTFLRRLKSFSRYS